MSALPDRIGALEPGDLAQARLAAFLRDHVEGMAGTLQYEQLAGGQSNPTYRIRAADGRSCVLRRKPFGELLPSAHAIEREFRVLRALSQAGFPVARPLALCEDVSVVGSAFYVMDHVDGRVLWDQSLPGMSAAERRAIWDELNRVIAQLHGIDYRFVGLEGFGKPDAYIARQIDRWTRQYRSSETESIASMDDLIAWLPANIPTQSRAAVVHGDFRLDNVIFHVSEPRVLAVLDWELSTLGDPLADFAYHCLSWHIPPDAFRGIAGLPLRELGIPEESEYVAAYCARTLRAAIASREWDFYIAYNLFRIAAILQGIIGRVRDGTATSEFAPAKAEMIRPLADKAWEFARQA